jgi:hypothetical protein
MLLLVRYESAEIPQTTIEVVDNYFVGFVDVRSKRRLISATLVDEFSGKRQRRPP